MTDYVRLISAGWFVVLLIIWSCRLTETQKDRAPGGSFWGCFKKSRNWKLNRLAEAFMAAFLIGSVLAIAFDMENLIGWTGSDDA